MLAAIIEAEGIEPTEEEMLEAVGQAAGGRTSPKKLLERLKSAGRLDALKEDLAQRKALDLVTESAKPVAAEAARLDRSDLDARTGSGRARPLLESAVPLQDSSARSETKRGP